MPVYNITTDTGLLLTLEADGNITYNDVTAFLKNRQKVALESLAAGPQFRESGITSKGRRRRTMEPSKEFYSRSIPAALNIPEDKFNYSRSLPFGLRSKLDFLQDQTSKSAILRREYGEDNVASLNLGGNPTLLFRDPETGEWSLADSMEFEFADITADIVGDILPVGAGILSGTAALLASSPTAVASVGTVPLATTAAASAAAEATVGAAQDVFAKKAFDLDTDLSEIRDRRAKEMAVNFAIDLGTMKAGKVFKGLLGKEGVDVASKEVAKTSEMLNRRVPTYMMQGEEGIKRSQDIASKFPDSTSAAFMEDVRDAAGQRVINEFGVEELSAEGSDKIIRKGMGNMVKQTKDDIDKIQSSLDNLAIEKASVQASTEGQARSRASKEAKKAFDAELQRKAKNVVTTGDVSPEKIGLKFQQRMASKYVEIESASRKAFEDAYFKMQNARASASELSSVFGKIKNQAILDNEDDVIRVLAPTGRTASGRAVDSLEDIAGESISFKQINELVQLIEQKTKRGAAKPGFNASSYRKLADELRKKRATLLNRASPEARKAFNAANKDFRNTVLPFRESDIFKSIRPEIGQNYSKAINSASRGENVVLPKLSLGGTEVISTALRNPKNVKDFLRSSGNSLEAKKLLREAWLSSKGLTGGQPIPRSALKFSPADLDIARSLWPAAGEAGFNRKVETLKRIAAFADSKDEVIEGLTAETFNRIMNEGVAKSQRELAKIGAEEIAQKKALDKLTKSQLVKLMGQGKIPLPNNSTTMESLADGILKSNPSDVTKMIKRMQGESPELFDSFKMAIYQSLTRKAGRGTDAAQMGKAGFQLWNPGLMSKELIAKEDQLIAILGKESYQNIKAMNDGIKRFSVQRGAKPSGNVGAATSGTGISVFFSQLPAAVSDRFAKHILAAQIATPFPFKKILSGDQYNKLMNRVISGLFVGSNSTRALMDDADADPEFRKKMTEMYSEALGE